MNFDEKIATVRRNCTNARRALDLIEENEKNEGDSSKGEGNKSGQTNSQFKDDSSFLAAAMALSFGENSENKKAKSQTKQNVSQFQVNINFLL